MLAVSRARQNDSPDITNTGRHAMGWDGYKSKHIRAGLITSNGSETHPLHSTVYRGRVDSPSNNMKQDHVGSIQWNALDGIRKNKKMILSSRSFMRRPRPRHLLRDSGARHATLLQVQGQRGRQALGDAVSIHPFAAPKICSEWEITILAQKNIFAFAPALPSRICISRESRVSSFYGYKLP